MYNQVPQIPQVPPKKSKTGLIVGIVISVIVLLLIIGGATAFLMMGSKSDKSQSNSSDSSSDQDKPSTKESNAITAKYVTEFEVVCNDGSVTNAAASAKPYIISAFYNNNATSDSESWSQLSVGYGESYKVDLDKPEAVNVVACLKEKSGTAAKSKTCEFESRTDGKVSIDYYSVEYDLTYYEAKTGKKIKAGTTVNGPANTCPGFAAFSKTDPKIYAKPDETALETQLKAFAQ